MGDADDLTALTADGSFDGGDLDCGSGLALLIREHLLAVPIGRVLEIRSREPSVGVDLPPWCRLTGHEYLGALADRTGVRYFIRRGAGSASDALGLTRDKVRARAYEWRARVRITGARRATTYCRNLSFHVGQPASFEERDAHPSAIEYVLGAVASALAVGLSTEASRDGLTLDDVELTVRGRLHDVLAHLGSEDGDPSLSDIDIACFVTTSADEGAVRAAWTRAVARCPVTATLRKAATVTLKLSLL